MADYTKNYHFIKPALEDFYDIADQNGNMDIADSALQELKEDKVDKSPGKGLSTNDYTNEDKTKLANVTGLAQTAMDTANAAQTTAGEALAATVNKVDKVAGKGLSTNDYTGEDKAKVAAAVPNTRTVNGKPLTGNINLAATEVGAIPATEKGVANGVAILDGGGKIPSENLPPMNYIPAAEKAAAGGVASLDGTGKVPTEQLPPFAAKNHAGTHASGGSDPITPASIGAITDATSTLTNYYTKTQTLSSGTKTALGLGASATPDNATNALLTKINAAASYVTGSYTGNGTYDKANPTVLTLGFKPSFVAIQCNNTYQWAIFVNGATTSSLTYFAGSPGYMKVTWNQTGISFFAEGYNNSGNQLNYAGYAYHYIAFR